MGENDNRFVILLLIISDKKAFSDEKRTDFLIASFCAKKNNQGFVETFQGLF